MFFLCDSPVNSVMCYLKKNTCAPRFVRGSRHPYAIIMVVVMNYCIVLSSGGKKCVSTKTIIRAKRDRLAGPPRDLWYQRSAVHCVRRGEGVSPTVRMRRHCDHRHRYVPWAGSFCTPAEPKGRTRLRRRRHCRSPALAVWKITANDRRGGITAYSKRAIPARRMRPLRRVGVKT